ncbi:MAG: hypothetical protein ACPKM0_02830 [Pleomorphochaeta sp.]
MKKLLILIVSLIFVSNIIMSSDLVDIANLTIGVVEGVHEATESIENPKYPSFRKLKLTINEIDPNEVDLNLFYKENKIPTLMPLLKNLVLGFGLGSEDQGKPRTAVAFSIIDGAIVTTGIVSLVLALPEAILTLGQSNIALPISLYCLEALAVTHCIQAIDALLYPTIYNARLKRALKLKANYNPKTEELSIGYTLALS